MVTAEYVRSTMVDKAKVDEIVGLVESEVLSNAKIGLNRCYKGISLSVYTELECREVLNILNNHGFDTDGSFINSRPELFCFYISW